MSAGTRPCLLDTYYGFYVRTLLRLVSFESVSLKLCWGMVWDARNVYLGYFTTGVPHYLCD